MDFNPVQVRYDPRRRVFERLPVQVQLLIGGCEVRLPTLVLPGEVATIPDVCPAVPAHRFRCAALEGEDFPGRVHVSWRRMTQHSAQVEEMILGSGAFLQFNADPLLLELNGLTVVLLLVSTIRHVFDNGSHRRT